MANAALEALRTIQNELAGSRADAVPEGWKTVNQWADESGLAAPTVAPLLEGGCKLGRFEKKQFRIPCGKSGVRHVAHFRQVEEKPDAKRRTAKPV